jgi:hypothetical protein
VDSVVVSRDLLPTLVLPHNPSTKEALEASVDSLEQVSELLVHQQMPVSIAQSNSFDIRQSRNL